MKHTTSSTQIAASPLAGLDPARPSAATAPTVTLQCHNLRPTASGLTPVGVPPVQWSGGASALWDVARPDGYGHSTFMANGTELWVADSGTSHERRLLATLTVAPTAVAADGLGRVTVMCRGAQSPYFAAWNTGTRLWEWLGQMPRLPMPMLSASALATVSQRLPRRKLKGSYGTAGRRLVTADLATLSADYLDAYTGLHAAARARGAFLQPVAARVRVTSRWGDTLDVGPALIIMPPLGAAQALTVQRALTASSDGGSLDTAGECTLEATAWRLKVDWPEIDTDVWSRWVGRVDIEVGPQLHPADPAAVCDYSFPTFTSSGATLELGLPGVSVSAATPGAGSAFRQLVLEGALTLDATAAVALTATRGSTGWTATPEPTTCHTAPGGAPPWREETAMVRRAAAAIVKAGPDEFLMRPPWRFTAQAAHWQADAVMWGNLSWQPWRGASAARWATAADADSGTWTGWVHTDFAREGLAGRCGSVTTSGNGQSLRPLQVGPLVVWPDPRAVSATFSVGTRRLTLPLQPTPDGLGAFWLADDLAPVAVDDWPDAGTPVAIGENPWEERRPALVVLARRADPLHPVAWTTAAAVAVTALAGREQGGASLEFGRLHVYAFGQTEAGSLTIDASRSHLSYRRIDSFGVTSGRLLASGGGALHAVSGRSLVRLSGSGARVIDASLPFGVQAAAWDVGASELWLLLADGSIAVGAFGSGGRLTGWYTRDVPSGVGAIGSGPGGFWLCDGNLDIRRGGAAAEEPLPAVAVKWQAETAVRPGRRPVGVALDIGSGNADGTVSVALAGSGGAARTLTRLNVHGALDTHLGLRLPENVRPAALVRLGLDLTVDPETRLRCATLAFEAANPLPWKT